MSGRRDWAWWGYREKKRMFWCGDSKVIPIRKRWLSLFYQGGIKTIWKEEIFCGLNFGIPVCCIFWYVITVYLCLIFKQDVIVMNLFFGDCGWANFAEIHYYKCPLCRILNHTKQVRFDRWH